MNECLKRKKKKEYLFKTETYYHHPCARVGKDWAVGEKCAWALERSVETSAGRYTR